MNITVGKKATAEAMSIENSRRKPGEDWVAIVQRNGTKEFAAAFAPNPVLDSSVMNGPCVGVEVPTVSMRSRNNQRSERASRNWQRSRMPTNS
jgi:hypothetical protein